MGILSSTLSVKKMALYTRQLSVGLNAGVPILQVLETISGPGAPLPIKRINRELMDCIRRGATLSQAIHWKRRCFPSLFVGLISVGERCGSLERVLKILAGYYDELLMLQYQFWREVSYPLAVLFGIFIGIPIMRAILIAIFLGTPNLAFVIFWILVYGLAPFVTVILILAILGRITLTKRWMLVFAVKVWPFSVVMRRWVMMKFSWAMALMNEADIPPYRAILEAARITQMPVLERECEKAALKVRSGATVLEALSGVRYLSKQDLAYIEVYEHSGRLEEAFRHIAQDHYASIVYRCRSGLFLLEGFLIILIGLWICNGV